MIVFFILLLIFIYIIYMCIDSNEFAAAILYFTIWIAINVFIYLCSYSSYINARIFHDTTIEQYTQVINIYEEKALKVFKNSKIKKEDKVQSTIFDSDELNLDLHTDIKYTDYQKNMMKLIQNLQDKVTEYNECIISKRIWSKNIFFNWYIVEPDDDLKPLKLKEVIK